MKKQDLLNEVLENVKAQGIEISKKDLTVIIDATFQEVFNGVVAGEEVPVGGLGKMTQVERAERNGRNPVSGESIVIPASLAPKFKPSKGFKDAVKASK